MLIKRALFMGALVISPMFIPFEAANAWWRICNRTSYVVQGAIAFRQGGTWVSRGWYTIGPGGCRTVLNRGVTRNYLYYYFRHTGGPSRVWQGRYRNCVRRQRFVIYNSTQNCGGRGYGSRGMRQLYSTTFNHTLNLRW